MSDNSKRTVFLVDDDPSHNEMLKNHLAAKLDVNITTFSTGEDCLRNLDKNPDVVVLDYNLDSESKDAQNGIEILKKIKAADPSIEVIMLSGQEKLEVAVETMKYGAFDYVIKNESAFVRTQNIVFNVFKGLKLQENLSVYKKSTLFLSVSIVAIIIIAIILVKSGYANSIGWI